MIKVVIADDQRLIANSLKSIIEQDAEIKVVGCATNGLEALELCNSLFPDVVLMDVIMAKCDGVEGTKLIKSAHANIKVLILTMYEDQQYICKAMENGADGYILKDITPEELAKVIKNVYSDFTIISTKAYEVLRQQLNEKKEESIFPGPTRDFDLKEDEIRLIRLIAAGKNNREIARLLYLSEGRIKNIITELLRKMKLKNRYELLSFVYKNNLID